MRRRFIGALLRGNRTLEAVQLRRRSGSFRGAIGCFRNGVGILKRLATSNWGQPDVHGVTGSSAPFPMPLPVPASPPYPLRCPRLYPRRFILRPRIHPLAKIARTCRHLQTHRDYDHLTYNELQDLLRRRGFVGRYLRAVLKTRPAAMDAPERKRKCDMDGTADTSEILSGKRNRAMEDAMGT